MRAAGEAKIMPRLVGPSHAVNIYGCITAGMQRARVLNMPPAATTDRIGDSGAPTGLPKTRFLFRKNSKKSPELFAS